MQRTGKLSGWSVDATGQVAIRLTGNHEDEPYELWFATPPNRTNTTRFEELVVDAVLAHDMGPAGQSEITIMSQDEQGANGRSVESAFPILALRRL